MVFSDLGGWANGNIGLILSPDKYNVITPMPFIQPLYPSILVIPPVTTQVIITEMQTNNKVLIQTFKEFLSVKASLWQHIITIVDKKCIANLCNRNTNSIKNAIGAILEDLFDTYGKIMPHILNQCEDVFKQMNYDVYGPVDTILNDVKALGDIANTVLNPCTNQQYINLDYNIINKNGKYKLGLWKGNLKYTYRQKLGCI